MLFGNYHNQILHFFCKDMPYYKLPGDACIKNWGPFFPFYLLDFSY
jgi:hypothetical protein